MNYIIKPDAYGVELFVVHAPTHHAVCRGNSPDDARRIMAALNAVEGIPTEALEKANIPAAIEEIGHAMQMVAEGPLQPADAVKMHRSLDDALTYCGHTEPEPQP